MAKRKRVTPSALKEVAKKIPGKLEVRIKKLESQVETLTTELNDLRVRFAMAHPIESA